MIRHEQLFDPALPRLGRKLILLELFSGLFYWPRQPDPAQLPPGQGRTVLVIPPFGSVDLVMSPLRRFLGRCGFRAVGWGMGTNLGPTQAVQDGLRVLLDELAADGPVSVVGISMGGLLARDLARSRPGQVRSVATLGSPYVLPTVSPLESLVRRCAPRFAADLDVAGIAAPLPMPTLSIYTRKDGIVRWQSCRGDGGAEQEVGGRHIGIQRQPDALRSLVRFLAA